ncbi:hypothetical protein K504DRAFT_219191 [Pleomassaria siparia CBS 279.74]|uniref:Uncharacterized protein n=1 Tax=Pleomassaria siparia CBS 279.74 TaxID=1314801 RepID=A0A6G1KG84_9PLEO|nr:hypothetical protein K504DRAFT_219191 [Pleomassaria siparia CBS 279.74]
MSAAVASFQQHESGLTSRHRGVPCLAFHPSLRAQDPLLHRMLKQIWDNNQFIRALFYFEPLFSLLVVPSAIITPTPTTFSVSRGNGFPTCSFLQLGFLDDPSSYIQWYCRCRMPHAARHLRPCQNATRTSAPSMYVHTQ